MARLEITLTEEDNELKGSIVVTLSEKNLRVLLHKAQWPESKREVRNNDVWLNGRQAPWPGFELVMSCTPANAGGTCARLHLASGENGSEFWITLPEALIESLLAGQAEAVAEADAETAAGFDVLVRQEDDETHYGRRPAAAGVMHPDSEAFSVGSSG